MTNVLAAMDSEEIAALRPRLITTLHRQEPSPDALLLEALRNLPLPEQLFDPQQPRFQIRFARAPIRQSAVGNPNVKAGPPPVPVPAHVSQGRTVACPHFDPYARPARVRLIPILHRWL